MELIVESGDFVRTYAVAGVGGPRYPYLERDGTSDDVLPAILKSRAQKAAAPGGAARRARRPIPRENVIYGRP